MSLSLQSTEKMLDECKAERRTLYNARNELQRKLTQQEMEHQTQIERFTSTINDKERVVDEANWKRREMMTTIENLEGNQLELKVRKQQNYIA